MSPEAFGLIVAVVVGFIGGLLVGAHNKSTVDKAVAKAGMSDPVAKPASGGGNVPTVPKAQ